MNQAISKAIQNRQVLQFSYQGGIRTVEPHCLGVSSTGKEVLRAFQTGGYSESGNPVGWKLFSVAEMSAISTTGARFVSNRPHYNPNDSAMTLIYAHV